MKSSRPHFCAALVVLLFAPTLRADQGDLASLLKERDAVLSKIVSAVEERSRIGGAGSEDVFAARLALCSFRRDSAENVADKFEQQSQIVGLHEKRLANMKSNPASDPIELLRATDAVLEAKQRLESLRAEQKSG